MTLVERLFSEDYVRNDGPNVGISGIRRTKSQQRLYLSSKRHRFNVDHLNAKKLSPYYEDLYHTLLNLPSYRFLLLFVGSYVSMYIAYALFYMSLPPHCVSNVQKFTHALWFSVHTAATIGYGHQSPDPDCIAVNVAILFQVLTGALMQAALLGLVFARFASPSKRGATIKFSSVMVNYENSKGERCLAFRVANLRHHQVLMPKVTLLLLRKVKADEFSQELEYRYYNLKLTHISGHDGIWLGLPSVMSHKIDEKSPLTDVSEAELEETEAEFVVMLDGVDEMTSTTMQARHSYFPSDIVWNQKFAGILTRGSSGALAADYSQFDKTVDMSQSMAQMQSSAEQGTSSGATYDHRTEHKKNLHVSFGDQK